MKKDCPDGDDEVNCIPSELCPYSTSHRCSDSGECIGLSKMCNHDVDCPNGEDEMDDYCYHPGIVQGNVFQESSLKISSETEISNWTEISNLKLD